MNNKIYEGIHAYCFLVIERDVNVPIVNRWLSISYNTRPILKRQLISSKNKGSPSSNSFETIFP